MKTSSANLRLGYNFWNLQGGTMKIKKIAILLLAGAFFLNYLNADLLEYYAIKLVDINEEINTTGDITGDNFTHGLEACFEGNALVTSEEEQDPDQIAAFINAVVEFSTHINESEDEDADNQEAKDAVANIANNLISS